MGRCRHLRPRGREIEVASHAQNEGLMMRGMMVATIVISSADERARSHR
jgi:hypothetical protein